MPSTTNRCVLTLYLIDGADLVQAAVCLWKHNLSNPDKFCLFACFDSLHPINNLSVK